MYSKILLAYDGSRDGGAALAEAEELAVLSGAEVILFAVVDIGPEVALAEGAAVGGDTDEQLRQTREVLAEGAEQLRKRGIRTTTDLAAGHPGERIAAAARNAGADLIVLGHREHGWWARWMQEPVGPFLLADPPCSLLICAGSKS